MPELPEVEVLARHLRPLILGETIRSVEVRRAKVLLPTSTRKFQRALVGSKFVGLVRRGKYLLFQLRRRNGREPLALLGHLGMTGRMFLVRNDAPLPKHAAVVFELDGGKFIYEDTRYFGRLTLDVSSVERLGPEPLSADFDEETFAGSLKRSRQPIKIKLLDQTVVAGVGNIYASEALFRARISPKTPAAKVTRLKIRKLRQAIRAVLSDAIKRGSTVPISFGADGKRDGFFYFGRSLDAADYYEERLRVYDRKGEPCWNCRRPIKCIVQAARSTFFCPSCQPL